MPEGRKDYENRRSSVEALNDTFKNIFNYDRLQTRGLERVQGFMFRIASACNTISIFNIVRKKGILLFDLIYHIRLI